MTRYRRNGNLWSRVYCSAYCDRANLGFAHYASIPWRTIKGKAVLFGDNESVITSSTLPDSRLTNRHNALSYHRVREAIAVKIMNFIYKKGQKIRLIYWVSIAHILSFGLMFNLYFFGLGIPLVLMTIKRIRSKERRSRFNSWWINLFTTRTTWRGVTENKQGWRHQSGHVMTSWVWSRTKSWYGG